MNCDFAARGLTGVVSFLGRGKARRYLAGLVAAGVLGIGGGASFGVTWTGADSSDWADALNWNPNGVPTSSTNVSISLPGVNVTTAGQNAQNLFVGDAGLSTGTLTISSGGTLATATNDTTTIGNGLGSHGTITVTGAGSTLSSGGAINVGVGGNGELDVLSGGNVSVTGFAFATIGSGVGVTGTAKVDGANSSLTAFLAIIGNGASGSGNMTVSNGGHVAAAGELIVGLTGNGTLSMESGATATLGNFAVGQTLQGTVTVSDTGTKLTASGTVGAGGNGSLSILNGATMAASTFAVGGTSAGNLTISGTGSAMTVSGTSTNAFAVGQNHGGVGTLSVLAGGTLTTQVAVVGQFLSSGATGNITVSGAGSSWGNAGNMVFTQQGTTGSLNVLNGGKVTTSEFDAEGGATVTIDGAGSSFVDTTGQGSFDLGILNSTHSLSVTNGGSISANSFLFSGSSGAISTVTVSGANSTLSANGTVTIADSGTANMTVSGGATVTGGQGPNTIAVHVGMSASGTGLLTLTDAGTTWTSNGQVDVGDAGNGTMMIENGAKLTSSFAAIGEFGKTTITGAGSMWDSSAIVGNISAIDGNLSVLAGGTFKVSALFEGVGEGGSIDVSGANSTLISVQELVVSLSVPSSLTVENGGAVTAGPGGLNMVLGSAVGGIGTLNVGTGGLSGTVTTPSVTGGLGAGTGSGVVNFNHTDDIVFTPALAGNLAVNQMAAGNTTLTGNGTYTGNTTITAGVLQIGNGGTSGSLGTGAVSDGTSLVFDRSNVLKVTNAISGAGSVTQAGNGTTIMSGASNYLGGTTVNLGKVVAENLSGSATGSGPVITKGTAALGGGAGAANGGTVSGTIPGTYAAGAVGVIAGAVTIDAEGILAPGGTASGGESVGTLTVGSLELVNGSVLDYEFNAVNGTNDFTATTLAGGLVMEGGGFNLYQEGTTTPFGVPGVYHLLGYNTVAVGLAGSFSVLDPAAGDSYGFSLNDDLKTVDLTITGSAVPEPGSLGVLMVGGLILAKRRRQLSV